jgi:hypothetical protein
VTVSASFGSSAKVTGTTWAGSAACSRTPLPPLSSGWPTSMIRAPGTTTLDSALTPCCSSPGNVATMSTMEPGSILPATPVSASTRIAISRSPVASSGGEPIMPSWSTLPAGMSAIATWPIRRLRSRSAVWGAQRRGSSIVLTMSSEIALSFSAGLERASTRTFGSTSARTSAT